jgi:SAM-dependent methyltransferase
MSESAKPRVDDYYKNVDPHKYAPKFTRMCDILEGRGNSFLDVAGGVGGAYFAIKDNRKTPFDYTLVDFSDAAIARAAEFGISGVKHNIDASALPVPSLSHDVVILADVLEHLRNPWALLADAARVSKEYVYVSGPNFASLLCRLDILRGHPVRQMVVNKTGSLVDSRGRHTDHIHFLTYANLVYWAEKVGLEIDTQQCFIQKKLRPIRKPLDAMIPNLAESYCILFKKKPGFVITPNPNLEYYDFL